MNNYGLWATYSFIINDKKINVVAKDIESAEENVNKEYEKERLKCVDGVTN